MSSRLCLAKVRSSQVRLVGVLAELMLKQGKQT